MPTTMIVSDAAIQDRKMRLSTLWVFATLNYLYCDLVTLMDSAKLKQFLVGRVGGMDITQGFLLASGVLMEISIAMVLLSRVLKYRTNRKANVGAGVIMTAVQVATLFMGSATAYYWFVNGQYVVLGGGRVKVLAAGLFAVDCGVSSFGLRCGV